MLEKMEKFYETELKGLERTLNNHYAWTTPKEIKNNALQRMLGIAYFAEDYFDLDHRDIEALYNEYRGRVEAL